MKRRNLLKFLFFSAMAAAGGTGFLKIYKHATGVKNIIEYPAPVLRKISRPVDVIDDKIIALSRRMIATVRYFSLTGFLSKALLSRGLSACQVGVSQRLVVCGIHGEIKVLINPELIEQRGAYTGYESCLSLPSHGGKIINRPGFVRVRYRGIDNREKKLSAAKSDAALLAHEIDHLNGTLYIDYQK